MSRKAGRVATGVGGQWIRPRGLPVVVNCLPMAKVSLLALLLLLLPPQLLLLAMQAAAAAGKTAQLLGGAGNGSSRTPKRMMTWHRHRSDRGRSQRLLPALQQVRSAVTVTASQTRTRSRFHTAS